MHQPGEPHVDVILDRIKQVIARDHRPSEGGRAARGGLSPLVAGVAEPEPEPEPDHRTSYEGGMLDSADADEAAEVLELGEDGIVPRPAPMPDRGVEADNDTAAQDADEDVIAYDWSEPEGLGAAAAVPPIAAGQAPANEGAPLTRTETRTAMRDNLLALNMLSTLSRERRARGLDDVSIDALARDLLRPMLADWLDHNLPPMVERLVQEEIRRIVGEGS